MAVRMRLTRIGSKKNPIYRVVVADSRSPRDGRFIEIVGRYNPQTDPSTIELDEAKVRDWLSKGAQPSEPVATTDQGRGHLVILASQVVRVREARPFRITLSDCAAGGQRATSIECGVSRRELPLIRCETPHA